MAEKPELIVVSQYCLGGVFSFYENLLSYNDDYFEKKIILLNAIDQNDPIPVIKFERKYYEIFDFKYSENPADIAQRLQYLISNKKGLVITNFLPELASLHLYRKNNKSIYYICHDEQYVENAIIYSFLIDVFIAHNPAMYEMICEALPNRLADIYFIPYGVIPSNIEHLENKDQKLNLVFLGRHVLAKGILDLPLINQLLIDKGILVEWTIYGDGRDTKLFREEIKAFNNFHFHRFETKEELYECLKNQDLMIHPSSLDGLPVAILEAMSAGVVPIMYEFNKGIKKLFPNETAVIVPLGDYTAIVNHIIDFNLDRDLLLNSSKKVVEVVNNKFNLNRQAAIYYNLFKEFETKKKPFKRKFIKHYKSWLDHPLVPAALKSIYLKLKSRLR